MSSFSDQTLDVCLTARELEVLALVADGLSAKEIALRIDIGARTVERHIDNARLKMRARNRTHLVMRAVASGLLDTPEADDERAEAQLRKLVPEPGNAAETFVLF